MINWIIAFSIRNRLLVLIMTAALIAASIWGTYHLSLDAIPDLSDVQVIIVTQNEGQNPEVMDKQITYPLASAMLSVPKATAVRGYSMFGLSFVYVLFEDGTDIYWARSRVLEYLNFARDRLPKGVEPKLGPDATGVGWVYQYVLFPGYYSPDHPKGLYHDAKSDQWFAKLEDAPQDLRPTLEKIRAWQHPGTDPLTHTALVSSKQDLSQLRSLQDWYLRYPLTSVQGVSEVAPIGGFVKQYQVILDPQKIKAYNIPLKDIMMALQRSNNDVGGSTIELSENEYMVRSRGYLKGVDDISNVPVGMATTGTPIHISDIARVQVGGEMRRGIGDFNGQGELAGGVVIARFGENAYQVIQNVKAKIATLEDGLPPGVFIIPTYDRSALIERAIHTLRHTLIEEITVVGLVCILFLLHARSELVAVFVVPASVLVALLLMHLVGMNANIMSLGGIAIAIGVVVDSAIVMVENAHKHLDREEERLHAAREAVRQGGSEAVRRSGGDYLNQFGDENDGRAQPHSKLSRSDRLAEGHESSRDDLQNNGKDAGIRAVRPDQPNAPSSGIDPLEHRGGLRPGKPEGLHQVPPHSARLSGGTDDAIRISNVVANDPFRPEPPSDHPRGTSNPPSPHHQPQEKIASLPPAPSLPHCPTAPLPHAPSLPHCLTASLPRPRIQIILEAAQEVGPSLFFSLLIITVSFLPVFVLGGESGRLFKPLALTKTFAMAAASLLSITIIPVLMYYFITARVLPKKWGWQLNLAITLASMILPAAGLYLLADSTLDYKPYAPYIATGWATLIGMLLIPQKIIHENHSPISNVLQWIYNPFFHAALKLRWLVLLIAAIALATTYYPITHFGTEFMPRLDEGDLLYMPTTDPSLSVTKAGEVLQQTDKLIKTFPEVASVHGKIGRADTATDPAPMSMIETVIQLEPDKSKWRTRGEHYFFSHWPAWAKYPFTHTLWPETRPITTEELRSGWTDTDGSRHAGLNQIVSMPGIANAWPYPIENRTNMLSTGIKTPVGIKVLGPDLDTLNTLASQIAAAVSSIRGTVSAYPERALGGYYLDIDPIDSELARNGLTRGDVQDVIQTAIGGMTVTTTVEGPARYPLNIRFANELRDDLPALKQLLVSTPRGYQIPLGQLATLAIHPGPPMIRSENAQLSAWVYVDVDLAQRDLGGYVAEAKKVVADQVQLPAGYTLLWSGQFEYWEKTLPRLIAAIAVTVILIIFLLYAGTQSWFRVGVVLLALPFSLIGACWFTYLLGYNLSLAVYIGMIALAGLDAETGLVMLLYLDNSFDRFKKENRLHTKKDLWHAVHDGAVKRIRPKAMTVAAAFIGLVPLLWATGSGADVMRRLAAPLIGGLAVSFIMELLVYPVIFYIAKGWTLPSDSPRHPTPAEKEALHDALI